MIDARLPGAARTLVLTLRARADEQQRSDPLLDDAWSADWYPYMPEYPDYDNWYNPIFQLATVIRSRLIDDAVVDFIEAHDNPLIVELGAGFSTRYYRIGQGRTRWIEMDLEQAIVVRRKLDTETADHWFLPADLTETDWIKKLPEADPDNTLFIAEGSLMFADPDGLQTMIDALRKRFKGAAIVFDVVNPGYIEHMGDMFEALSAPMRWGVYEDDLSGYGFDLFNIRYLLLEYPARWEEIGITEEQRVQERSGYIVEARLA